MGLKIGFVVVAACGVFLAIGAVIFGAHHPKPAPILFPPATSPYAHAIAGEGSVEASTDNILIGTPFNEIVWEVFVKVGDKVTLGTPLFSLDCRTFTAQLNEALADRDRALVEYANRSQELALYNKLTDKRAVSVNSYNQIFYAAEAAKVAIQQAESKILVAQSYIDRSLIKAPCDGEVLQLNIHKGEVANINPFNIMNLVVFGPVVPFHLRVTIDEDDAWRFQPNTPAMAYVRGNSSLAFPLKYVRTEPLMVPKQNLTGSTQERVDTRVLVAIYAFETDAPNVYAGQLMDVYIEAHPATIRFSHP